MANSCVDIVLYGVGCNLTQHRRRSTLSNAGSIDQSWPITFKYAAEIFCYMRDNAIDQTEGLVYKGSMMRVFHHFDIPRGSWGPVKRLLQDTAPTVDENGNNLSVVIPCLTLLRRGGGNRLSEWLINRSLSESDLVEYKNFGQPLTPARKVATLLSEHEERIAKLESRIRELESRLS